jgi:hypothetical protein
MADDEHDYKVGPGKPPLQTRFKKGQSGNPGGRRKKQLPALLADALDEPVFVTIDGERRQITKREAIVHQLVNKSTTADLRATKMLFDMMKDAEQKAGVAAPSPEPRPLGEADKEVVRNFVERIRRQVLAELAEKQREAAAPNGDKSAETAGSSGDNPAEIAGSNGDSSDDR